MLLTFYRIQSDFPFSFYIGSLCLCHTQPLSYMFLTVPAAVDSTAQGQGPINRSFPITVSEHDQVSKRKGFCFLWIENKAFDASNIGRNCIHSLTQLLAAASFSLTIHSFTLHRTFCMASKTPLAVFCPQSHYRSYTYYIVLYFKWNGIRQPCEILNAGGCASPN